MDAEVSMRNTMIVMSQEWRGRETEFKNGQSDAYFETARSEADECDQEMTLWQSTRNLVRSGRDYT